MSPVDADLPDMDMATFLMASAHDMKNSISIMAAFLESALAGMPQEQRQNDAGAMTHQALYEAQRLNHHLIQLMALYKMNRGMYPFDPVDVDLAEVAAEVCARVRPAANCKGIELDLVLDPVERTWYFDYELIVSVIVQALHNGIKYTRDRVCLSLLVVDDQLDICVADNGTGYPAFMLDSAYPVRQAIDSATGSTGLGLYFAARAARLHRNRERFGVTRLENGGDLGGGRFVVRLP